jgi:hypothetical protein
MIGVDEVVGVTGWRTWVWSFSRRASESSRDCTVSAMAIGVSEWMCDDFCLVLSCMSWRWGKEDGVRD